MPHNLTPYRQVALAAVLVLVLSVPGAARADGGLLTADPATGSVLVTAPTSVTLEFSAEIWLTESHLAVLDQAGKSVSNEVAAPVGERRLRVPVRLAEAGDFTVAYHVAFLDGTSVTGAHRFSYGTGQAPAPLDPAASRLAAEAVSAHAHSIDGLSATLLVVDGLVLLGVVMLLVLRPRDKRPMSLAAALREDS
jgi:methionine-rich copper-binding protein CopC